MKVKALVEIELVVADLDDVSDIIHETWTDGDSDDTYNACIVVNDVTEVEWFSWEMKP